MSKAWRSACALTIAGERRSRSRFDWRPPSGTASSASRASLCSKARKRGETVPESSRGPASNRGNKPLENRDARQKDLALDPAGRREVE